ncbi:MAG: hypothetical protein FJ100_15415 [Deltaproteobacteria bacterium]|nr:hypothetical protein [Deltaproteobacteria bacterium]
MSELQGHVPGKLMLAGEYAVLRPPALALAVAVGRLVRWQAAHDGAGLVRLTAFGATTAASWADAESAAGLIGFAGRAWSSAARAWPLAGTPAVAIDVAGSVAGQKIGLGNSAAVTVAVLRARAGLAGATPDAATVAELARDAHRRAQAGQGSGYDVATVAHGGVVAFEPATGAVERLAWPAGLSAVALFVGEPAATAEALPRVQALQPWLAGIAKAALALREAWVGEVAGILTALAGCEAALWAAEPVRVALFSPAVEVARAFLHGHGLVARLSGAGGGDCVLGFGRSASVERAAQAWQARGGYVAARLPADLAHDAEVNPHG